MKTMRTIIVAAALAAGCVCAGAQAQTRIALGHTASVDYVAAFAALGEGYFKKRGLDVELIVIPLNSNIPVGLQSGSLQVGGPTAPILIQAIDGGLDLVALAAASLSARETAAIYGIVARTGSNIRSPQDFVGRKVGAPGLGASMHITFRHWLRLKGVDYRKVSFVEVPFPQHPDVLKGGSIDAVLTADPFMPRILKENIGYVVANYGYDIEPGQLSSIYTTTRDWATKNAAAASGFREAIAEGGAFANNPANLARMRELVGVYLKLPPPVIATTTIPPQQAQISAAQLNWWIDVLKAQDMLRNPPSAAAVLWN